MSKERAQRRAVREAEQAAAAQARAVEAERLARSRARKDRLSGWVPRAGSRQTGALAERRARELRVLVAVLVAVNLLVFAFTRDWYITGLTLVASVLGAPIIHLMLFRKG